MQNPEKPDGGCRHASESIEQYADRMTAYARRLEKRIKEQRDQLEAIHVIHADKGNKADRRRLRALETLLGQAVLKSSRRKAALDAVVGRMQEIEADRDRLLNRERLLKTIKQASEAKP